MGNAISQISYWVAIYWHKATNETHELAIECNHRYTSLGTKLLEVDLFNRKSINVRNLLVEQGWSPDCIVTGCYTLNGLIRVVFFQPYMRSWVSTFNGVIVKDTTNITNGISTGIEGVVLVPKRTNLIPQETNCLNHKIPWYHSCKGPWQQSLVENVLNNDVELFSKCLQALN